MTVIGLVFIACFRAGDLLAAVLGPIGAPVERGVAAGKSRVKNFLQNDTVQGVVLHILVIVMIALMLVLIGSVAWVIYMLWMDSILPQAIGFGVGLVVALIVLSEVKGRYWSGVKSAVIAALLTLGYNVKRAGKKAEETPVINRIWGVCPIDIRESPKWFTKITEKFE